MGDKKQLENLYRFDELNNTIQMNNARDLLNRMRCNCFLVVGVDDNMNFSIHSELYEHDLKYLLEKLIKSLPDGKAVVKMDGI